MNNLQNWAGSHTFGATRLHRPTSVEEVQELVAKSRKIKALGTRHSFNDIADTTGDLLSLEGLNRIESIDRELRQVTVQAGITYGQLCRRLNESGYSLHNLASLPHISVGGACATATHGSGDGNGNLATAVAAMKIVTADGTMLSLSREDNGGAFDGAVVGLGGLGIVTRLTLDLVPAFEMRQIVYEDLPFTQLEAHYDDIASSGYSVSLFTSWRSSSFSQVWVKQAVVDAEPDEAFYGASRANRNLHPIRGISAVNCTEQMGIPGPWHERLPHFRMDYMPSAGEELQSEYLVPRVHAFAAIRAVEALREHVAPLLLITEVRTIAADTLWMSPCYKQACVSIHFTWKKDWAGVSKLLPVIEQALAPFSARPHWGKLFTMPPDRLRSLYSKMADFQTLIQRYDPGGKFRNAFLDRYIFS